MEIHHEKVELNKLPKGTFLTVSVGIIFDTKKRMILIGRRIHDRYVKELSWTFPGGLCHEENDLEENLEELIHKKTGMKVKNLGCVFSRIFKENRKILLMYYLCETVDGSNEKPGEDIVELKWVKPEELESHFTTSFDPRLKEYIMHLK